MDKMTHTPGYSGTSGGNSEPLLEQSAYAIAWAMDDATDSSMASADWLANDIDPDAGGAVGLVTGTNTSLDKLRQAKAAYKTMRIVGETARDRRVGARMYLAAIASALVHHDTKISSQSPQAIRRNLEQMKDDRAVHHRMRELAQRALRKMH